MNETLHSLAQAAWRIRRYALRMGEVQGQGYVGQALGWADVLAVAYRHALHLQPDNPLWEGRDRFLLSHGHYAIAHYAALIEAGVLPESEQKKNPAFIYNSMSDGELDEGSTWEAAMGAAHHRLDNLICLIDINNQQADGPSSQVMGLEPLADKWAAFGWHVQRVDGNDLPAVLQAFDNARNLSDAKPRVILFDTLMGKGVPFLETRDKNHFIRVDPPEWQLALDHLDATAPQGAAA
jgi:transketolase